MEDGFRTRPKVCEQYEKELQETRQVLGGAHVQVYVLKNYRRPVIVPDDNKKPIQRILQIKG